MLLKVKKLREAPNPKHPDHIDIGFEKVEFVSPESFSPPKVGERFYVGNRWVTSKVVRIIDEKTFETLNSVYEWEMLCHPQINKTFKDMKNSN